MAKVKRVKKLEPVFEYKVDDIGVIHVYTFDTDYNCYFVAAYTRYGPYDEQIYAAANFDNAKDLVEYAYNKYATTDGDANAFKVLLDDKDAMSRLQEIISNAVEGEWW